MIKTLLIGGAGFVGSYLISLLNNLGREVTVLGRKPLDQSHISLSSNFSYIQGDFGNLDLIKSLLDTHQEVIHLAYATVPNTSFSDPLNDLLENLPPTVQLFLEAAARNVKVILISSGGTVYGTAAYLPIDEQHATEPISPYGVTKLTLENYAHLYSMTHGLQYICIRPANAYGIGQRPFSGQGFISTAMACMLRTEPVTVFGDGSTVRDYIHVADLARGIVAAIDKGKISETYNVGSGIGFTNLEVLDKIAALLGIDAREFQIKSLPARPFDVYQNVLSSAKLRMHTGWSPEVDFAAGLSATRDWLIQQHWDR